MTAQVSRMKRVIVATAQITLWGMLTLLSIALIVIDLFSAGGETLTVGSSLLVSSSSLSAEQEAAKTYLTEVTGTLTNKSDSETLTVESLQLLVSDGTHTRQVTVNDEPILLPPRVHRDFSTSFEGEIPFDRFESITAVINGESVSIQSGGESGLGGAVLFYAALLTVSALLLIRACRIRYYLWQQQKYVEL